MRSAGPVAPEEPGDEDEEMGDGDAAHVVELSDDNSDEDDG